MCKDPDKDRMAAAGNGEGEGSEHIYSHQEATNGRSYMLRTVILLCTPTMGSSWFPLRTENWSSAPRRGVILSLR
jgi:hypothetical protein